MTPERRVGRYTLFSPIATGGMATVHLGRLSTDTGFARTVAVKRLHPHFASDPELSQMFLDEARIVARIQHPNVVAMLDVVSTEGELFLVMDYVLGESLSRLLRAAKTRGARVPLPVAMRIAADVLHGLHAAHEAVSEAGQPLQVVHRDVSPQNVIVGVDGVARVLDFGIAKAVGNAHLTRDGSLKGKIAYMPPEQVRGVGVDRRADVYAASVVIWEMLTQHRFLEGGSDVEMAVKILSHEPRAPSEVAPDAAIPKALDDLVMRGLARAADARWPTALDMVVALEDALPIAPARKVSEWVHALVDETIARRTAEVREMESASGQVAPAGLPPTPTSPSGESLAEREEPVSEASAPPTRVEHAIDAPRRSRSMAAMFVVGGGAAVVAIGVAVAVVPSGGAGGEPSEPPSAAAPARASIPEPAAPTPPASASADASQSARPPPPPADPSAKKKASTTTRVDPCANPFYKDGRGILRMKEACK